VVPILTVETSQFDVQVELMRKIASLWIMSMTAMRNGWVYGCRTLERSSCSYDILQVCNRVHMEGISSLLLTKPARSVDKASCLHCQPPHFIEWTARNLYSKVSSLPHTVPGLRDPELGAVHYGKQIPIPK